MSNSGVPRWGQEEQEEKEVRVGRGWNRAMARLRVRKVVRWIVGEEAERKAAKEAIEKYLKTAAREGIKGLPKRFKRIFKRK